jgi:dolichyl-phosphate-mannose--protein O-mannosyl transferase
MFSWWRKRDWRAGYMVVPFLMQWVPWMLVSRPQFFFYALPLTPFMILAAVYALRDISDAKIVLRDAETGEVVESTRHPYRPIVWAYLILAVGLFAWFWPVLVGSRLSDTMWRARVWFPGWI